MRRPASEIPRAVALAALVALMLGACAPAEPPAEEQMPVEDYVVNALTQDEMEAGWRLLFDGQSFDGWRGLGMEGVPTDLWEIQDGVIRKIPTAEVPVQADGQPLDGNDLMTVETFENFEFAFEFRVDSASNSGIKYNVSEEMSTNFDPPGAALGFEFQVLDPAHPDYNERFPLRVSGALYDLLGSAEEALRPTGEWNQGRLVFDGNRGEHWLNGVRMVEYDLATAAFDSALAASKYADIEGFADRRVGHIVLQDHLDEVWYRNLKIRVLP